MVDWQAFEVWFAALLGADATLVALQEDRVYAVPKPPEVTLPCTTFEQQPGARDVQAFAGGSRLGMATYQVLAMDEADNVSGLGPIEERLQQMLDGVCYEPTGLAIRIRREGGVIRGEVQQGTKRYAHLGGNYRVVISPTV